MDGGGCSQIRTGLRWKFPANREINREFRDSGPQKPISVHETTVLQRLFTKFPTQVNRENILKNREFLSGNREFHLQGGVSIRFSHACSSDSDRLTPRRVNGVDIHAHEVDLVLAGC